MKWTLIILFLWSGMGYAQEKTTLKIHTQEIAIEDHKLSSIMFQKINTLATRFDQLNGVYKLGKFTYCRTVLSEMRCYLYLSLDLDGSLSSPWVDPDFGKGDAIDYVDTKPKITDSNYLVEKDHVFIWFHGGSAREIFSKIPAANLKFDDKNREIRQGKHIVCAVEVINEKDKYACFIKVPLNHIKDPKEEPKVQWGLSYYEDINFAGGRSADS